MGQVDSVSDAQRLVESMSNRRSQREPRWRELSRWVCPTRGMFEGESADNDDWHDIIRFTHAASQATLRGASGMTSGMTPRNISWFKPDFCNEDFREASGARIWLDRVDRLMKDCLANGGFYQAIQQFNMDLLWSGCALLYAEKDEESPLRYETVQVGTFMVETDRRGQLLAVARSLNFTCEELVNEFGEDAVSAPVKEMLKHNPWETVKVWHLCRLEGEGRKPVSSRFWEAGASDKFLLEDGYFEMPFFFTVWHEGHTPYGIGPGDDALADARQMDELERRKLEGLAKLTEPPMVADSALKDSMSLAPAALNFLSGNAVVRPIIDLSPFASAFGALREEIALVQQRLDQTLYASIFTSMPLDQRPRDMSATEFLERKREALQQLGPVISAYEPNVLTPLLYRTLQTLDRNGAIPVLPEQLQGQSMLMTVEFISPMANALRQTGAETTRAIFQDVAQMASAAQNPELLDKLDMDQMVDVLATSLGCDGSIIRADSDVAQIRQQRAQAQQQQMAMQQAQAEAQIMATRGAAANEAMDAVGKAQEMEGEDSAFL